MYIKFDQITIIILQFMFTTLRTEMPAEIVNTFSATGKAHKALVWPPLGYEGILATLVSRQWEQIFLRPLYVFYAKVRLTHATHVV